MTMSRWFAVAAIALASACSSNGTGYNSPPPPPPPGPPPPPPPPSGGHSTTVTVSNYQFTPTPDTIPAGQVTFQWSATAVIHNVIWDTGPGTLPTNSGDKGASESYQATLVTGTYTYHCGHHAGMSGEIVVTP